MLHPTTFEYLKPTDAQIAQMTEGRQRTFVYANAIEALLPDGSDKTYILRRIRETAMWINVSITCEADGTPRT